MKIDIITLHGVANYGSVLQAYATQCLLEKYGCSVNIINYIKYENQDEHIMEYWCGKNIIKKMIMLPTIKRWRQVFGTFNRNYLNLTPKTYKCEADFDNYNFDADGYCIGSDQVWNTVWNNGIIKPLYLDFIPNRYYKFALSSSFGKEHLEENEIINTKKYMSELERISVREYSAVDIFKNQYGIDDVTHLIDPTLAVDASVWRELYKKTNKSEKYILLYSLNKNRRLDKFADKAAKKLGVKLIRLCYRYDQIFRGGIPIVAPEVLDFIALIDNAEFVITDSFHATAFSINMNKKPICAYPKEFGGRINDLLKMFDIMQCHLKDYNDVSILRNDIEFTAVNDILEKERDKVGKFIMSVIEDINTRKSSI